MYGVNDPEFPAIAMYCDLRHGRACDIGQVPSDNDDGGRMAGSTGGVHDGRGGHGASDSLKGSYCLDLCRHK